MKTGELLGVTFDKLTVEQAADWAMARIQARERAYICTANPEILWSCRKNAALRQAVADADLVLADGVGVVWASRVLGDPLPERCAGYDFFLALLSRLKGRVFLLGGKPGIAERAVDVIEKRFPEVTVCGAGDGYFQDDEAVLADIQRAAPDFIAVCLGSPRQERWMAENKDRLPVCVAAGLGGSLDVLAGRTKRAPEPWIRLNLEWLYRLLRQPWRIKRQLCLPLFAAAIIGQRIRHGKRKTDCP